MQQKKRTRQRLQGSAGRLIQLEILNRERRELLQSASPRGYPLGLTDMSAERVGALLGAKVCSKTLPVLLVCRPNFQQLLQSNLQTSCTSSKPGHDFFFLLTTWHVSGDEGHCGAQWCACQQKSARKLCHGAGQEFPTRKVVRKVDENLFASSTLTPLLFRCFKIPLDSQFRLPFSG